jgi:hypothetical protein
MLMRPQQEVVDVGKEQFAAFTLLRRTFQVLRISAWKNGLA